jgi:very-short-patch-repair endonuclease
VKSPAETLLAVQLDQAGIPFEREHRFCERKWRFDFIVWKPGFVDGHRVGKAAIEVEGGSYTGGHKRGRAYESDCDKNNAAMDLGWRVYRFTPAHVNDERALEQIRRILSMNNEEAA